MHRIIGRVPLQCRVLPPLPLPPRPLHAAPLLRSAVHAGNGHLHAAMMSTMVGAPLRKKITTLDIRKMRSKNKPITMCTAYTYPSAVHGTPHARDERHGEQAVTKIGAVADGMCA